MDNAFEEIGGIGLFQILNSLASMILFAAGSQFFYSMPFYEMYPSLTCFTADGQTIPKCSVNQACG